MRKLISLFAIMAIVASATVALAVNITQAQDSTVIVSGDTSAGENMAGWLFNRDASTSTPYEFNADAASIGTGSVYIEPIGANAPDKFIAENFINAPIADVDSISYDFQIGAGGEEADMVHFYMNVYANFGSSDDLKFYDCRYNIVPTSGSVGSFTTVTFDPNMAYPVTTRGGVDPSPHTCPAVPADMDTLSTGSNIRVFALNVGDTSVNDQGLDGYLDNVIVSVGDDTTTYDFEPFTRSAMIHSPVADETITDGSLELHAVLNDADQDDTVQWAVREGTCGASTGTVAGNVDGYNTIYDWDQITFSSTIDVSAWDNGSYCFIFNPSESTGDESIRETVNFMIENEDGEEPARTGEITSPEENEVVTGNTLELAAILTDDDNDDDVNWAVRTLTCNGSNVAGNVGGFNDDFDWDGANFSASLDTASWADGVYCFVFNPTEGDDESDVRETVMFTINHYGDEEPTGPMTKDDCKNGGWMTFTNPSFKNQGQCVSYVATGRNLQ